MLLPILVVVTAGPSFTDAAVVLDLMGWMSLRCCCTGVRRKFLRGAGTESAIAAEPEDTPAAKERQTRQKDR